MKIYLSGKISGIEDSAFELFEEAEKDILIDGHEVVNPIKLPHKHDKTWEAYMKECVKALMDCDAVYALSNWKESKGARMEVKLAKKLNIRVIKQNK